MMQHKFGSKLARSTVWRREKRDLEGAKPGRFANDQASESFIRFTGGVIGLVNAKGYCHWRDLFEHSKTGLYRYCETSRALFDKLASAPYAPAMLAVAICALVPLNWETRGGPNSASNIKLRDKVMAILKEKDDKRHPQFDALKAWMKKNNLAESEIAEALDELSKKNPKEIDEVVALCFGKSKEDRFMEGTYESVRGSKGTPPHRVPFHAGAKLSRQMASHWRCEHKDDYERCKNFLRGLLKRKIPKAPHPTEDVSFNAKEFNALLSEKERRRKERLRRVRPISSG